MNQGVVTLIADAISQWQSYARLSQLLDAPANSANPYRSLSASKYIRNCLCVRVRAGLCVQLPIHIGRCRLERYVKPCAVALRWIHKSHQKSVLSVFDKKFAICADTSRRNAKGLLGLLCQRDHLVVQLGPFQ